MTSIKLLACDIDGTILRSDGTLSQRTRDAIALAQFHGTKVCLVTGRRIESAMRIVRELELKTAFVAHCGAVVIDPGYEKPLMAKHIPASVALSICNVAEKHGLSAAVYENVNNGRSVFMNSLEAVEEAQRLWPNLARVCRLVKDFDQACAHDPIQLAVRGSQRATKMFWEETNAAYGDELFAMDYGIVENGKVLMELMAAGISKGTGAAFLADLYGFTRDEVAGFGDSINDRELLEYAGLSVAMGNSPDFLKDIAVKVAPSCDEDGVAQVIEVLSASGRLAGHPEENVSELRH